MKKAKLAAIAVMAGLMLYGCSGGGGSSAFPPEQSAIYINRDGEIYSALVKEYDTSRDYYDAAELKAMAEKEVAAYNAEHPVNQEGSKGAVTLTDCTMENGKARIVYQYADGTNLSQFTGQFQDAVNHAQSLEVSTVAEGLTQGKVTDGTWIDVKKNSTAALDDVMKQSKLHLVSVNGAVSVQTEGKILYYSGNVTLKDEFTAEITEGNAYLVFK